MRGAGRRLDRQRQQHRRAARQLRAWAPTRPASTRSSASPAPPPTTTGPLGIRVNVLAPGPTETPDARRRPAVAIPGGVEARIAATPLRKAGTGAEVGEAAAWFLLSDRASHISGVVLPGGRWVQCLTRAADRSRTDCARHAAAAARVHVGYGARAQLPRLVAEHGTRVLAVVDPFLAGTPELRRDRRRADARPGSRSRVHTDVIPELPVDSLDAAGAVAAELRARRRPRPIGGGSALDAAKVDRPARRARRAARAATTARTRCPGRSCRSSPCRRRPGTGSEVTPVAVVSDPDRELKVGISSPYLVPVAADRRPRADARRAAHGHRLRRHRRARARRRVVHRGRRCRSDWATPLPVFTGRNALRRAARAARRRAASAPCLPAPSPTPADRGPRARSRYGQPARPGWPSARPAPTCATPCSTRSAR